MDNEIKRLLKLENIPGFVLLDSEKKKLEEWKKNQKRIKPVKKTQQISEGFKEMEMGANETPAIIEIDKLGPAPKEIKVVKNFITQDEKND